MDVGFNLKQLSKDHEFIDASFIGTSTFEDIVVNGEATFSGNFEATGDCIVIKQIRYISSLSCLNTIMVEQPAGSGTFIEKYVLEPGLNEFVSVGGPFILDKPFHLDDSTGGTINIVGNFFLVFPASQGALFQQEIGNFLILRLSNTIVIAAAIGFEPFSRTLFDLKWDITRGNPPVILGNFTQFLGFLSIGTLAYFDTVVLNNLSFRFNVGGLTIDNTFNLLTMTNSNLQNALAPLTHVSVTAVDPGLTGYPHNLNVSVIASGINFIPNNFGGIFDLCIYIEPILTPNISISQSVFDNRNTFAFDPNLDIFYDQFGQTESSIYVSSINVKNVKDSTISARYFYRADPVLTVTIDAVNQWHMFPVDGTGQADTLQRTFVDSFQVINITSLEKSSVQAVFSTSFRTNSTANPFEVAWFEFSNDTVLTVSNGGDTAQLVGTHTFQVGDEVTVFRSSPFPVGALEDDRTYSVVDAGVGAYIKVANIDGGAAINLTLNDTYTVQLAFELSIGVEGSASNNNFISLTSVDLWDVIQGTQLAPMIRTVGVVRDAIVKSFFMSVKK
jgi:hypothetical protein